MSKKFIRHDLFELEETFGSYNTNMISFDWKGHETSFITESLSQGNLMYLVKSSSNKGYAVWEIRFRKIFMPPPSNPHSPCQKEHKISRTPNS